MAWRLTELAFHPAFSAGSAKFPPGLVDDRFDDVPVFRSPGLQFPKFIRTAIMVQLEAAAVAFVPAAYGMAAGASGDRREHALYFADKISGPVPRFETGLAVKNLGEQRAKQRIDDGLLVPHLHVEVADVLR